MPKVKLFNFILWIVLATHSHAAFVKNLWPAWGANNPLSTASIDHSAWQGFLDRWVIVNDQGIHVIDYVHMQKTDIAKLKDYINQLAKIDINGYSRDEQLAFWINLYNALTVSIIAEHYPVDSIEEINISPGLFSIGPWGAKVITINGTALSLDEIHNRIIRPIWNDPRTHYAVNNGSIGAADLSKEAYQGKLINQQLNRAATKAVNSLRSVQVIEGKLLVSKVYEWYCDDFGGNTHDIINHIKYYAEKPLRDQLGNIDTIESYMYNWHLNSTVAL